MDTAHISSSYISNFFVCAKKEEIEKALGIDNLNIHVAIIIIDKYIQKNKKIFFANYSDKYDILFDKEFFAKAIDTLKYAQKNGTQLHGLSSVHKPSITFVV